MKKPLKFAILIGLTLFLGINLYLDLRTPSPMIKSEGSDLPVGTSTGDLAPDFEGITLSGEPIRLSDARGKVVLLNIFASWCGPCKVEAPHLAQVYDQLGGDEVVFIGLNLEEKPEDVAAFKAQYNWDFPLVLNQDGKLTEIYQPLGLPTSWFIDPNGVIKYVHTGPVTAEMLTEAILDIQEGRDPNPFSSTN